MLSRFRWINNSKCLCCGYITQSHLAICSECRDALVMNVCSCQICRLPLPYAGICGSCQKKPPAYSRVYAPYIYEHPIDQLISQFKYRHNFAMGLVLVQLMGEYLQNTCEDLPDLIVPLPLHWQRQWRRGFNQSVWIAKRLSKLLDSPISTKCMQRRVSGAPQQSLPRTKRLENVKGSFVCKTDVSGLSIALFDDVMTTGATAQEATRCLKEAGAKRVDVWCLARTPLER